MEFKLLKYKFSLYEVLLFLLVMSGFFHQYIYIGIKPLHLIRVLIPLMIFYIVKKRFFNIDLLGQILIKFYIIYFFITSFSSIIYFEETAINDYINFTVITILSIVLLLFMYADVAKYLKIIYISAIIFFFISAVVALYEVSTLEHLRASKLFGLDKQEWWDHYPTAFQFNPNDFASTIMLIVLFVISYNRIVRKKVFLWSEIIILLVAGWLSYETHSRLVQLVFFISLIVVYSYKLLNFKRLLLFSLIILFVFYYFHEHIDRILLVINKGDSSAESITSTTVRLNILKYGLLSVKDSWGIGFGVYNYDYYYTSLPIFSKDFHGVTMPHFYPLEILLSGGIIPLILWIFMYILFSYQVFKFTNEKELKLFVIIYPILLAASSSILFNYSFYILFIGFIGLLFFKKLDLKNEISNEI